MPLISATQRPAKDSVLAIRASASATLSGATQLGACLLEVSGLGVVANSAGSSRTRTLSFLPASFFSQCRRPGTE